MELRLKRVYGALVGLTHPAAASLRTLVALSIEGENHGRRLFRSEPEADSDDLAGAEMLLRVCSARPGVVVVTGELDLSTRDQLMSAATAGRHPAMVIDLTRCTFMDCCGYGALVASRLAIERDGRSLTITGQNGQPARLWKLIADLEPPTTMPWALQALPC